MSSRTNVVRRARQDWQKEQRREDILSAAERLYVDMEGVIPTVAAVASAAGVAKGTLYLYFKTKEEIFLGLLDWRFSAWFSDIETQLDKTKDDMSPETVVASICHYIEKNPLFLQLAGRGHMYLEEASEIEVAFKFKENQSTKLQEVGSYIERYLPGLPEGRGWKMLLRSYAFILGLRQLTDRPAYVQAAIDAGELEYFTLDFHEELKECLLELWQIACK